MTSPDPVRDAELLGCPFCGGEAEPRWVGEAATRIECRSCEAEMSMNTRERAIAAWNRRAAPADKSLALLRQKAGDVEGMARVIAAWDELFVDQRDERSLKRLATALSKHLLEEE